MKNKTECVLDLRFENIHHIYRSAMIEIKRKKMKILNMLMQRMVANISGCGYEIDDCGVWISISGASH